MAQEFIEGLMKITNIILALVAGYLAVRIARSSRKKELASWKALAAALVFFMVQQFLGVLRAFDIYSSPYLTHIVPTIILGFLILALSLQIHYTLQR